MKHEKPKQKLMSCNIKFPERVWEPTENGWGSRPATSEDQAARREVADSLGAVIV